MGSPRLLFGSISFTSLLQNLNADVVADHINQLGGTLREFYPIVKISPEDAAHNFSSILSEDSRKKLMADYTFQVGSKDAVIQWKAILYRTQIPHFESGVAVGENDTEPIDPQLPHRLVEKRLASVVVHKTVPRKQRRVRWPLFGANGTTTIVGDVAGIYLISKMDSIPSLRKKWKWEVFQEDSFRFSDFWAEVSSKLNSANTEPTVRIPFDRIDPLREFVAKCDSEMFTALTRSQLEIMLAIIDVSFDEWFGAKI